MRAPLSLPLAPPGDAPPAYVFESENTNIQDEQVTPTIPPFMVEIFVTVRVIPFPLLQPSRFVFPAFPELAGLPPGHASVGFFGVTAIRPSSGVKPEMSSVRVRRRRGSSFGEVSGAHHLVYESSYENDCPRKVPTCKAHGESRARGNAPNTCNTPPRREASPTEPQVCSMTASPRFCARRRLTGLRWRRARRHSPLNGPERAAVHAFDKDSGTPPSADSMRTAGCWRQQWRPPTTSLTFAGVGVGHRHLFGRDVICTDGHRALAQEKPPCPR